MTGTIKTLVREKHFGFIAQEGVEKDLFFHSSSLQEANFEDLKEGQAVSFDIDTTGEKGPSAKNVTLA